jgi:rubrerythrin
MAYEQVGTVLEHACKFHEHVSLLYSRLAGQVNSERAKLLLQSMREHEARQAKALNEFLEEAPQKVLQTWLTSSADSKVLLRKLEPHLDSDANVDELIQLGTELSDDLIKFYEELAARGEPASVREFFQNFLEEERQEERQFVKQALRCQDI